MRVVSEEYEKKLNEKGEISGGHIISDEENSQLSLPTGADGLTKEKLTEDRLAYATMSKKERYKTNKNRYKEATKDMTSSEKFKYFIYVYKWYFLTPLILALFIGWVYIAVRTGSRPIALSYAMINVEKIDNVNTDFYDEYFSHYNFDSSYREVADLNHYIDYQTYIEKETYFLSSDNSNYHTLSFNCDKGDYDIIITDEDGLKYCSYTGIINVLNEYFDEETYSSLSKYEVKRADYYGEYLSYGVDISNTDFAKKLNTGYDKVYIVFPGKNKTNHTNAYNFVKFLFDTGVLK